MNPKLDVFTNSNSKSIIYRKNVRSQKVFINCTRNQRSIHFNGIPQRKKGKSIFKFRGVRK